MWENVKQECVYVRRTTNGVNARARSHHEKRSAGMARTIIATVRLKRAARAIT
jgi:hypothetical protein